MLTNEITTGQRGKKSWIIHWWLRWVSPPSITDVDQGPWMELQCDSNRLAIDLDPLTKTFRLNDGPSAVQKKAEQAWLYSQKNLIKSSPFPCRSTPFFPLTWTSAYCDCCSFNQHPEAIHQTNYTDFLCPSIDSDTGIRRIVDSFALPVMIYENSSRYFTLHISPRARINTAKSHQRMTLPSAS